MPEPGSLDEQLQTDFTFEGVVAGRGPIADDRVGYIGVDVNGGRAGRPIPRGWLAADSAPGEGGAVEPEYLRVCAGEIERGVAPPERVARGVRDGVRQGLQDERLGVPKSVPS